MSATNVPGFQVSFAAGGQVPNRPPGKRFYAQLFLWTPLAVLRINGRFFRDGEFEPDPIAAEFGTWVPEPSAPAGWEPPELKTDSDVGLVAPSTFLPFLMAFRSLVESELSPEEQVSKLNRMHLLHPAWKSFVETLRRPSDIHPEGAPNLASVWFCPHLKAQVNGVDSSLAAALFKTGFITPEQVREATDESLLKVSGMNRGTLKQVRSTPR